MAFSGVVQLFGRLVEVSLFHGVGNATGIEEAMHRLGRTNGRRAGRGDGRVAGRRYSQKGSLKTSVATYWTTDGWMDGRGERNEWAGRAVCQFQRIAQNER